MTKNYLNPKIEEGQHFAFWNPETRTVCVHASIITVEYSKGEGPDPAEGPWQKLIPGSNQDERSEG